MKEEARRKKLGITRKVYDPEAQPWLMRVGGKGGRKYKVNNLFEIVMFTFLDFQGIREGGVSNNTTFYVFTHGKDGAFEAFPIKDWLVSWINFCYVLIFSPCCAGITLLQFRGTRPWTLKRRKNGLQTGERFGCNDFAE